MRLDIRVKDDVEQQSKCFTCAVTLDGVPETLALMADEELGEVLRFKQGADRRLIYNASTDDAVTELVKGVVVITLPEVKE